MKMILFIVVGFRYLNTVPEILKLGKISLLEEPDNVYDPKAIKVLVDNKHVGYIARNDTNRVHCFLSENENYDIKCVELYEHSVQCLIEKQHQ